jgi:hypothetical protein
MPNHTIAAARLQGAPGPEVPLSLPSMALHLFWIRRPNTDLVFSSANASLHEIEGRGL